MVDNYQKILNSISQNEIFGVLIKLQYISKSDIIEFSKKKSHLKLVIKETQTNGIVLEIYNVENFIDSYFFLKDDSKNRLHSIMKNLQRKINLSSLNLND